MQFGKIDDKNFLIRFEKGDDLLPTLKTFCQQQNIKNATFTAIGSIENPTLAHYRSDSKKYTEKNIEGIFEVTSLLGNVGLMGDDLIIHPHATVSNDQMQLFGGHLVKATVSATLEMTLTILPSTFAKKHSEEIGLNLYDLPENAN